MNPQVGIIMGSDSDLKVMQGAAVVLERFEVSFELTVVSAHRTPQRLYEYAASAASRGLKVVIAGAGGAAHLPGMVASLTELPVIGIPVQSAAMSGLDSLYSIVQMPPGVPVATVAINGAQNAGLLAVQILGVRNPELMARMRQYKEELKAMVERKALSLEERGYAAYLKSMEGVARND
ncbi:MAG: 5-(carboxyamino)imidazole ribonucleotide mutase [Bacillota bacterium]